MLDKQSFIVGLDLNTPKGIHMTQGIPKPEWMNQLYTMKEYMMQGHLRQLHLFEKVLFCLKEEHMNLDEIKKLPSIISLPILEVIRYAKLFQ